MKPIRQLLSYTTHLRPQFITVAILSVFTAAATLVTPFIMKFATDWVVNIASGKTVFSIEPLLWLIGALVAIYILDTVLADVAGYIGDMIAVRTRRQLSKVYYKHLLTLPQHYYDGEVTGKVVNRLSRAITDVTQFLQFFSNHLLNTLLTVVITVVVLLWYSWPLAVLFILLIPANLYITAKTSGKWQRYEGEKNKHFDIASGRFAEVIAQMRLVKSFGSEQRELTKFDNEVSHMEGLTSKQSVWWHSMNALRSMVYGTIFAAIYAILFYQTARGAFSVGDMVLLLTLIQQIIFPMRSMSFFVDTYQRAVANSKDFLAAMAEEPEQDSHTRKLRVAKGEIVYHNVSFAYEPAKRCCMISTSRWLQVKKLPLSANRVAAKQPFLTSLCVYTTPLVVASVSMALTWPKSPVKVCDSILRRCFRMRRFFRAPSVKTLPTRHQTPAKKTLCVPPAMPMPGILYKTSAMA